MLRPPSYVHRNIPSQIATFAPPLRTFATTLAGYVRTVASETINGFRGIERHPDTL